MEEGKTNIVVRQHPDQLITSTYYKVIMTKKHDTQVLRLATSKNQQQQLKIKETYHSYQLSQNYRQRTSIGEIHLKGHWLIQAGFEIDSPVKVRVMDGCLVLTSEP